MMVFVKGKLNTICFLSRFLIELLFTGNTKGIDNIERSTSEEGIENDVDLSSVLLEFNSSD